MQLTALRAAADAGRWTAPYHDLTLPPDISMIKATRTRLVFHGAVIMLLALACGLPSVVEVSGGTSRMWQAAHSAILTMAVWTFAQAAILSLVVLKPTELAVLAAALILSAYALAFAAIVQAIIGQRVFGPSDSLVAMSVFVANLIVVLGSALSAAITLMGARNATLRVPDGTSAATFESAV